jgi:osmotically inducible protein OsmC
VREWINGMPIAPIKLIDVGWSPEDHAGRKETDMPTRTAQASWEGTLEGGKGSMSTGNGGCRAEFSAGSRFGESKGTNPEEMIGAAHAGCFSMALSHGLSQAGHEVKQVSTKASVQLEKSSDGFRIRSVNLATEAEVPGLGEQEFSKFAEDAKTNCPVSKALNGVEIGLDAKLTG